MSVVIKRHTGWMGMGTNMKIKLDGEVVDKLAHNMEIAVQLPGDKANLRISHGGIKSDEIEIKDGDVIDVKRRAWYRWSFPLYFLVLFVSILIPDYKIRMFVTVSFGLVLIISMFFFNGYYLEIVEEGSN